MASCILPSNAVHGFFASYTPMLLANGKQKIQVVTEAVTASRIICRQSQQRDSAAAAAVGVCGGGATCRGSFGAVAADGSAAPVA